MSDTLDNIPPEAREKIKKLTKEIRMLMSLLAKEEVLKIQESLLKELKKENGKHTKE